VRLTREYGFQAAHELKGVPAGHKCAQLHGHSYSLLVSIEGEADPITGMVLDFAEIDAAVKPVLELVDHQHLNRVDGLANPTAEHVARWVWQQLERTLPSLSRVEVRETASSSVIFEGL
jgi:6-pyruvoyltetrahydropterin/6-carboxytetrahydropterin synthase